MPYTCHQHTQTHTSLERNQPACFARAVRGKYTSCTLTSEYPLAPSRSIRPAPGQFSRRPESRSKYYCERTHGP